MTTIDKSSMDACKVDEHNWGGPLACNGTIQGICEPKRPAATLHENACIRVVVCIVEYISGVWSAKEDVGVVKKVRRTVGRGWRRS